MMRLIRLTTSLALSALCLAAPALHAQEQVVDEGTLLITRNGAPVGREAFRVIRAVAGGGQAYQATATISFDSLRMALRLTTDSLGAPLTFEAEVRTHTELAARVSGSGRPGRFTTLVKTPHGEAARTYVMGTNPLLLDDHAFVPYFFATLPPQRTQFSIIEPRAGTQAIFRFEERGREMLRVGRQTENARHFALITPSGASRDIWVSAKGELLRIAIPAQGLVAQRDELPR